MTKSKWLVPAVAASAGLLFAQAAQAHPGHWPHGWKSGVTHPLTGVDHLLAILAVGLLSAQLGRRAAWALPLTFVAFMAGGGLLAAAGVQLPLVEPAVMVSVLVLGLLIAFAVRLPLAAVAAVVGVFAVPHGYAHIVEIGANESATAFGAGFLVSTGGVLGCGLLVGGMLRNAKALSSRPALRLCGGAVAACGLLLLTGLIG